MNDSTSSFPSAMAPRSRWSRVLPGLLVILVVLLGIYLYVQFRVAGETSTLSDEERASIISETSGADENQIGAEESALITSETTAPRGGY